MTVTSPSNFIFYEVPLTALIVSHLPYWPSPDLMWCPRYLNNKLLVKLYSFPDKKLKRTNIWFCRKLPQKLVHIGANMNNSIFRESDIHYKTIPLFLAVRFLNTDQMALTIFAILMMMMIMIMIYIDLLTLNLNICHYSTVLVFLRTRNMV